MSLLGSGLVGVGEEELEEALGRSRGGETSESGTGRESRVALYEFSDPLVQLIHMKYFLYNNDIFPSLVAKTELRSFVSIGDGAAGGGTVGGGGGGTSSGGPSASEDRAAPTPSILGGGGSSRTGERSKRASGSSRTKITAPSGSSSIKKKKEGPTGPLLYDNSPEWWGGAKVGVRGMGEGLRCCWVECRSCSNLVFYRRMGCCLST